MTPGRDPLESLAREMLLRLEAEVSGVERVWRTGELVDGLSRDHRFLSRTADEFLRLEPGTDRLLMLVDRWEELDTLCDSDARRRLFLDGILRLLENPRVRVVLTARGDFFGRMLEHRPLADAIRDRVLALGPMNSDEIRAVIERPASEVGLALEDGLVERIVREVGDEPGHLPLLEFVLTLLFEARRRGGGTMAHADYEAMGGVQGAIAARADEIHAKHEDEGEGEYGRIRRAPPDLPPPDLPPIVRRIAARHNRRSGGSALDRSDIRDRPAACT